MPRSTYTPTLIPAQSLIDILRRANLHYQAIAKELRGSRYPTHHARRRATELGLVVDIHKADNCPQRQISVHPLPLLDTMSPNPKVLTIKVPPLSKPVHAPAPRQPVLRCVIQHSRQSTTSTQTGRQTSQVSLLRDHEIRWRGPTSRWSTDSAAEEMIQVPLYSPDVPMDPSTSDLKDYDLQYPSPTTSSSGSDRMVVSSGSSRSTANSSVVATPNDGVEMAVASVQCTGKRKAADDLLGLISPSERHPKFARKNWIDI